MLWHISRQLKTQSPALRSQAIFDLIIKNRGLTSPADLQAFLDPPLPQSLTLTQVGLRPSVVSQAVDRIILAVKHKQPILIYGDYDADGITAAAILWETLHHLGARAFPFIPSRADHGYGLSVSGLTAALSAHQPSTINHRPLIITVDNGITAFEGAKHLSSLGLDLIITDHHQPGSSLPPAHTVVHTDQISGAGVAWMLAKELVNRTAPRSAVQDLISQTLDLTAIGTIADLMPVIGVNRSFIKHGLTQLTRTQRLGLQAVYREAGILGQEITPYSVGFIIAPRLNAMGRLDSALDSLRLLLTKNPDRAKSLAQLLGDTNRSRQDLTQQFINLALTMVGDQPDPVIIVDHLDFHEGIIGLVAGKLTEQHYRPAVVISRRDKVSKASARSVPGVNIINLLREFSDQLISVGGHPMAAGFTLATESISDFRSALIARAQTAISPKDLEPVIKIDCQVDLADLTPALYEKLETLKPFGLGHPKPVFAIPNVPVLEARPVGAQGRHLKLRVGPDHDHSMPAIGFNLAHRFDTNTPRVSLAATLDENTYRGHTTLQLNLKDIKF